MNTTYTGQACGGQSISPLSRGNTAPVSAKALDIPAGRIEALIKDGNAIANRLDEVCTRMLGDEPNINQAVNEAKPVDERHAYTGIAGEYQSLADELGFLVTRLRLVTNRLERA